MSGNDDISAAREYHEATSHSPHSIRAIPHFLDWNNQPLPFKLYRGLAPIALPRVGAPPEDAVGLVALGTTTAEAGVASMKMPPLSPSTEPSSPAETDYPAIRSVHSSSSLDDETEVSRWRQGAFPKRDPEPRGKTVSLAAGNESDRHSIEHIIRWRGSSRRFKRESIRAGQLSLLLKSATRGIPMEGSGPGKMMGDLYIIANAVEGLAPGSYVYHPTLEVLELLEEGDLRRQAGYLDLEQPLAGDAAVNVYTMTALDPVLETFGNRGYRLAQMEGGVTGGKLYLAAYSLGLGATGLTFYDDDVTEFFSPHARGKSVMFLTAVGVPGGRNLPPT